jgi:Bacteriocin-protection, YdeI or OmpD-Associated
MIGVNKLHRAAARVDVGDTFDVVVALDEEPRVVEVPADLAAALAEHDAAQAAFDRMSFTHRREYVEWIAEAKRPATRARRVAETVERVRTGPGGHERASRRGERASPARAARCEAARAGSNE